MNTDPDRTPETPRRADNHAGPAPTLRVGTNLGPLAQAWTHNGDNHFHGDLRDPWTDDLALLERETDANLRLMAGNLRLPGAGAETTVDRALFPTLVQETGDFLPRLRLAALLLAAPCLVPRLG